MEGGGDQQAAFEPLSLQKPGRIHCVLIGRARRILLHQSIGRDGEGGEEPFRSLRLSFVGAADGTVAAGNQDVCLRMITGERNASTNRSAA